MRLLQLSVLKPEVGEYKPITLGKHKLSDFATLAIFSPDTLDIKHNKSRSCSDSKRFINGFQVADDVEVKKMCHLGVDSLIFYTH